MRNGAEKPRDYQHCDTYKGDRELSKNPADPEHNVEAIIHYLPDGTISAEDEKFNDEIQNVLKLNRSFLIYNRKRALQNFTKTLGRRGHLEKTTIKRLLRIWNGESNRDALEPYCQVIVYWLKKRLNRA